LGVIVRINDKKYNVGAVEAGKSVSGCIRIHPDEGKLLREEKDIVDGNSNKTVGVHSVNDAIGSK
jgi:hypothetical protein